MDWRGQSVSVRETGKGSAILLLHGYPLDGAMWSGVARALSARFRVLKPDFPGRQDNPTPAPGTIDGYADYVEAILANLRPPVGLVGFSMGGYVALALMKRHPEPVQALALVDTRAASENPEGRAKRDEAIAELRTRGVAAIAEAMVQRLLSPESFSKPDLVERVRRIILRQTPQALESDLAAMRDRPDSTDFVGQITLPSLILVGEHDAISTPAESQTIASAMSRCRLVTIPGAGHLTPMEKPKAVAAILWNFFSETLGVVRS